ncbi:hypothetical protein [Herbiconiux flava]|uniref:Uncharacterized protein n=1 Tax=Herbiconiux flava TaxID=881268 RepID=A0A852SIB6_9MICO|nr:hypothetical protein [Herbiconiux flava]NYD68933.1 hypothetical protein [Herbiconiux flava]GLK15682.1 hypothetical protein GCM10017602_01640 [Herbiconiux flava]
MASAPMHVTGYLPKDAPDPRIAQAAQARTLPVPVLGFTPQPSLDDVHLENIETGGGSMTVGISYTLWRNPADRSDPVNLADLDAEALRSLEQPSPHSRPAWLLETIERMHYPLLWEAVRTTWHRTPTEFSAPPTLLVAHAHHILANRFRAELGLAPALTDQRPTHPAHSADLLTERAVRPRPPVDVDGELRPALEIDTDPLIYALAVPLTPTSTLTAVVPRADLPHVTLAFARRTPPTPGSATDHGHVAG